MGPKITSVIRIALMLSSVALAQQPSVQPVAPTATQPVSSSGLLPVFAVDFKVDNAWLDGAGFPSKSADFPSSGVSASFQKVWDALKPGGFNILRTEVDLTDLKVASNRAANLCVWAKTNNVMLDLVLHGASNTDYSDAVTKFAQSVADLLAKDPNKSSYDQIALYELEADWNNPSLRSTETSNQALLLKAASALRKVETSISQSSGLSAKPIVVGASLDYEMVAAKAIAGTPFDGDPSQKAYAALLAWLKPMIGSTDVDVISTSWRPGTISAGGAENVPTIVSKLNADLGGKQLLLRTGFSATFHSADEQKQYYLNTFSGLASLRATSAADSKLAGIVFQEALNAAKPADNPDLQTAMVKWDWSAKAGELAAMWRGEKKSADMSWWLSSIEGGMGLINAQSDALSADPLARSPSLNALVDVAQAVASASQSVAKATDAPTTGAATPQTADATATAAPAAGAANSLQTGATPTPGQPSAAKGFMAALGQTFQAKTQQGLGTLLDTVFQRLGNSVQTVGTGGSSGARAAAPPPVDMSAMSPGMPAAPSFAPPPSPPPDVSGGVPTGASLPSPDPSVLDPNSASANAGINSTPPSPSDISASNGTATGSTPTVNGVSNPLVAESSSSPTSPAGTHPLNGHPALVPHRPGSPVGGRPNVTKGPSIAEAANAQAAAPTAAGPILASARPVILATDPKAVLSPTVGVTTPAASPTNIVAPNPSPTVPATTATAVTLSTATSKPAITTQPVAVQAAQVPLAFAKIGDLAPQGSLVAGQPAQLMLPISNPNQVALSNIKAMLMIDGAMVQTQALASLMPHGSSSIAFPNVIVAQPGPHQVKIGIQLQRTDSKPQMGMFTQTLVVQPNPALAARSPTKTALPLSAPAVGAAVASMQTPPAKRAELTLAPSDLSYVPAIAAVGRPVEFHVVVHNASDFPTKTGALLLKLVADGRLVATTQPALQFSVPAKGTYLATWRSVMPPGTRIELAASVTADGAEVPGKAQATIQIKTPVLMPVAIPAVKPVPTRK